MQKTYRWEGDKVYFNAKINFFNNSILFKNGENITFGPFFGPSFTRRIAYGKEGPKKKVEGPKKFWSFFRSSTLNIHNFSTNKFYITNDTSLERSLRGLYGIHRSFLSLEF